MELSALGLRLEHSRPHRQTTMPGQNSIVTVSETLSKNPDSRKTTSGAKSSHWVDNAGTSFRNPWESYRHHTFLNLLSVSLEPPAAFRGYNMLTKCPFRLQKFMSNYPSMMYKDTREITQCLSVRKPTWGEAQSGSEDEPLTSENSTHDKIKATWLGHACFFVELPSRAIGDLKSSQGDTRGVRILFDPVFSDRCSPSQYMGPKRYTRTSSLHMCLVFISIYCIIAPPCTIEEIPEIDAVIISVSRIPL